jgi:hypothetical protein
MIETSLYYDARSEKHQKIFAVASELFMCAALARRCPQKPLSECILQGVKEMEVGGC